MEIVLINPPQTIRYPQPPIGLALIAAVLEKAGHRVTLLDANALGLQPEDIPELIDADIVGLTAMTPTASAAMSIARFLKEDRGALRPPPP